MGSSGSIGEESFVCDPTQSSSCDSGNLSGKTTRRKSSRKPLRAVRKHTGLSLGTAEGDPNIGVPLSASPKFFACPFYKLDPGKYGPWTDIKFKSCPGFHFTELRYIK